MIKKLVSLIAICSVVIILTVPTPVKEGTENQSDTRMTTNSHGLGG